MDNNIELLAPAGGLRQLKTALHFGADAVYGGLNRHGLRSFADNFNFEELDLALKLVHAAGKKFYLTLNAMPTDDIMPSLIEDAKKAYELGVDAAIVSDIGVLSMLKDNLPKLNLHISTQANTLNSYACQYYHDAFNSKRIILARELSIEQIKELRSNISNEIELEVFVHGAMCISYSGRCLLSNALAGRGCNQGSCAQSCRWQYSLVEAKRPNEYLPIFEDANGSYILSSYDLCMLNHLPELYNIGLSSLKIEGRMKSEYYVATVVSAYRKAIDALNNSIEDYNEILPELLLELDKVGHRISNTGFFFGDPSPAAGAGAVIHSMEYVAQIIKTASPNEETEVLLKNRFYVGDKLEVLSPTGYRDYIPDYIKLEKTGNIVDTYGVANEKVLMTFPFAVNEGDIVRGPNRNHR